MGGGRRQCVIEEDSEWEGERERESVSGSVSLCVDADWNALPGKQPTVFITIKIESMCILYVNSNFYVLVYKFVKTKPIINETKTFNILYYYCVGLLKKVFF